MSYGGVENTAEELADLKGATIKSIKIKPDGYGSTKTEMIVRFRDGLEVNGSKVGVFEVWMDVEGNGPGYLAYTGPAR